MLYQGSDGQVHVLGDGEELKHWKYIKKIKSGNGWRYFYSQDEINAYMKEVQGAAKGVKNKIDSIPRLQKHGDKYYIADKKTQKKIEKSGAGGNDYYVDKKAYKKRSKEGNEALRKLGVNPKTLSTDRSRLEFNAKETKRIRDEKEKYDMRYRYGNELSKSLYRAKSLAKQKSYEGAAKGQTKKYEQYEAKNVLSRPFSSVKKKAQKKINKGKKKIERKINNTPITTNDVYVNGKKVKTETYTVGDARRDYREAKKTYKKLKKYYGK